jgi:hypothetical protein
VITSLIESVFGVFGIMDAAWAGAGAELAGAGVFAFVLAVVFTPDAKAAEEQIDEDLWESKGKADTDEEQSAVDQLSRLLEDNPDLKTGLLK